MRTIISLSLIAAIVGCAPVSFADTYHKIASELYADQKAGGLSTNNVIDIASSAAVTNAGAVTYANANYLKLNGGGEVNGQIKIKGMSAEHNTFIEQEGLRLFGCANIQFDSNKAGGSDDNSLIGYENETFRFAIREAGADEKISYLTPDDTDVATHGSISNSFPMVTNAYPFALGNMVSNTVSMWEGYWSGSNVYWEVTNYLDTADVKIMRLMEIQTNGVLSEVWNDKDKYDIFFTNTIATVESTNAYTRSWVNDYVYNSLSNKADRAWGNHTSAGADAPTNMVWHTAPTTVFAGGFEFSKVAIAGGEIGVLVSKGCVPYAQGAEGKFIIGDGFGTNYFGFVKRDDYIIATRVDGIEVDQTTKMVTLTYDLVYSGEYPIVYYSTSVLPITSQNWIQLNRADGTLVPGAPWPVTFSTGAGYIKAHISFASATPSMPPDGFFTSSTAVIGGGTFKTNMKADFLDAGIMCTNTDTKVMGVIRPTFNGVNVQWNWSKQ